MVKDRKINYGSGMVRVRQLKDLVKVKEKMGL